MLANWLNATAAVDPSQKVVYSTMAAAMVIHASIFWRAHVIDTVSAMIKIHQKLLALWTSARVVFAQVLRSCFFHNDHNDITTHKVLERLNRQFAKTVIDLGPRFSAIYFAVEVFVMILLATGATWTRDLVNDAGIIVMHGLCIFVSSCPQCISSKTLPILYSAWMMLLCCVMCIGFTHWRNEAISPIFLCVRVVISHLIVNMKLKFFWNLTYVCIVSGCYMSTVSTCEGRMPSGEFAVREFLLFIVQMIYMRAWEAAKIQEYKLLYQINFQTKEHVAFNSLLSATYDVVVKLDASMCISEGADKLASMLLLGNGKQLERMEFQSLIFQDADKHRFTLGVSRSTLETHGIAHALHVHMRDGIGNLVAVALFHASVVDLDEQVSHIIGIRETNAELESSLKVAPIIDGTQDRLAPLRGYSSAEQASAEGSSESDAGSNSSASTFVSWSSMTKHDDGNPFLTVLADDEFTIIDCNAAFASLFGHTRPSSLEEIIDKVDSEFGTNLYVACRLINSEHRANLVVSHSDGSSIAYQTKLAFHSISKADEITACCIELQDVRTCLRKPGQKKNIHKKQVFSASDLLALPDEQCKDVSVQFEVFTASIISSSDAWDKIFGLPSTPCALKDIIGRKATSQLQATLQATLQKGIYSETWTACQLEQGYVECKDCDGQMLRAKLVIFFSDPKAKPNRLSDSFYVVKLCFDIESQA